MNHNQLNKNEILFQTAQSILNICGENRIELRLLGSIALLYLDTSKKGWLYENRREFRDIDFVLHRNDIDKLEGLMTGLNYESNRNVKMLYGNQRRSFYSPQNISIDFYIDNIVLCQTIKLKNRFRLSYPTLSPTDLLLTKIQRVGLTDAEIFDIIYLLDFDIDGDYIAWLSSKDWRWWKTFDMNLRILQKYKISQSTKEKIQQMQLGIEQTPKTFKWQMRNVLGPNIKWYNEVEDQE